MNVLVVEDEALLRHHLGYQLKEEGYNTFEADSGETGLHFLRGFKPDIAIVDLGLPGLDGVQMIEKARKEGLTTPILVLTARDNWRDKVTSLNAGADDYLVKPFELEELKARINALIRRSAGFSKPAMEAGPFKLDTLSKQFFINEEPVALTSYEFTCFELFLRNQNKVLSRAALQNQLYGADHSPESNVLEVLINRLRKKINEHAGFNPIVTVRSKGYRFDLP
ncbi:response regulator [Endozoicomonas ascidiicola]|uniref:response regulator n=1 Tax=Endozoicomonas ascidiicola TaxID=1698521 RepID=UPI00082BAC35|nr:response regulator [Endozoicomonas ascidiicola]